MPTPGHSVGAGLLGSEEAGAARAPEGFASRRLRDRLRPIGGVLLRRRYRPVIGGQLAVALPAREDVPAPTTAGPAARRDAVHDRSGARIVPIRPDLAPDGVTAGAQAPERPIAAGADQTASASETATPVAPGPVAAGAGAVLFPPGVVRAAWAAGPIGIVAVALLGWHATGTVGYLRAWTLAGAVFYVPALVASVAVVRRVDPPFRSFWVAWLSALGGGGVLGLAMLLQPVDPPVLHTVGATAVLAGGAMWVVGVAVLVGRTDGARVLLVDGLELLAAGLAVVAPVLVAAGPSLAHAGEQWFVVPATVAAAGLPLVAVATLILCVRLPAHQRVPETFGVVAAVVGEIDAVLLLIDAVHHFRLVAGPLLMVQALTQWLLLMVALTAHRAYPEGLDRLAPEAQVRRRSPVPLFIAVGVPALAVEAVTAHPAAAWSVPAVMSALGALVVIMTMRHLLVSSETRRLYGLLAAQAEQRRQLLGDLVRSVEHDRHRVVAQLHELAVETLGAIAAVGRVARARAQEPDPVVVSAIDRIYTDVNTRTEVLRRLMHAMRPAALATERITSETLATAIAASTANTFQGSRMPEVTVRVADDLQLDWVTSTIVYRIAVEALCNAFRRAPVTQVHVAVEPEGSGLRLEVVDDAAGRDLLTSGMSSPQTTLQVFADLARGTVEVDVLPSGGMRTLARLGVQR